MIDKYPDIYCQRRETSILEPNIELKTIPVPKASIGAFSVTKEDGSTYYYALPVYEWDNFTYIEDTDDADNITTIKRPKPAVSTWLLTAITGPDFIDRGEQGQFDKEDWGHWVKFEYGKFSGAYNWRIPYQGFMITEDGSSKTYTQGVKEQYYLNSIQTRSHTALFVKDLRIDGRGADNGISGNLTNAASSLRLDEIILLKNEKFESLQQTLNFLAGPNSPEDFHVPSAFDSFDKVLDVKDVTAGSREFLDQNALKRVKFNYSYDLCRNTLKFPPFFAEAFFITPETFVASTGPSEQ